MDIDELINTFKGMEDDEPEVIAEKMAEQVRALESERADKVLRGLNEVVKAYAESRGIEAVTVGIAKGRFLTAVSAGAYFNEQPNQKIQDRINNAYTDVMSEVLEESA